MITNRRLARNRGRFIGIIGGLVLVVGISFFLRAPLGAWLWDSSIAGLLSRSGIAAAVQSLGTPLASKAALEEKNQNLTSELARAQAELADRRALVEAYETLQKQFGREFSRNAAAAGIIARPPQIPYDTLLIDVGSADGVTVEDVVSAGGSSRIGTVAEVYTHTARVRLFSSPGNTVNALLHGEVPVVLEGKGGGALTARVPAATPAALGDTLVAEGFALGFYGAVQAVEEEDGDSFKILHTSLPANIWDLRFVEVLKGSGQEPH